ncbi:MAG: SPASM domain-containing protein [Candidatus Loosdrechtia sp.]|uniref:SPASM domain-containing protein n=1 Tax=Candidatus Loosdrechtia sp. TaxID=3101272 RepID=UPI003A6DA790|nr:MAG: SPASM domain-containing protein [Candidatus Jettenia sp. AMX2]
MSAEKYSDIAGVSIDFEQFLATIRHFYKNKGECKVFIKIAHTGLDFRGEEGFHSTFDDICNIAYVKYLTSIFEGVDYLQVIKDRSANQLGERLGKKVDVYYLPFYNLNINALGKVSPCVFDYKNNIVVGDIAKESLVDIWNGKKMNDFRRMHLKKERYKHADCSNCEWLSICACGIYENVIDDAAEKLIKFSNKEVRLIA